MTITPVRCRPTATHHVPVRPSTPSSPLPPLSPPPLSEQAAGLSLSPGQTAGVFNLGDNARAAVEMATLVPRGISPPSGGMSALRCNDPVKRPAT